MSTEDKSIQESSPVPTSPSEDDTVFEKVEAPAEASASNPVDASDLQNRDCSKEGFFGRIIKALSPRSKKSSKDSSSSDGPTAEEAPACEKSSEETGSEDGKLMTELVEEPTDELKETAEKEGQAETETEPSTHQESLPRKASTGSISDAFGKFLSLFKRLKIGSSSGSSAQEVCEEKPDKVSEDVKLDQNDAVVEKPQEVPGCADDEPLIKKEESAEDDIQASKQIAQ